jgi:hypothetical protein
MSIIIEKVYASHCRENYAEILNEVAPRKIEDVVEGLRKHFASLGEELAQCDVCLGWSPETLSSCPFCNDGRDPSAATPAPPAPTPSAAIVEAAGPPPAERKKSSKAITVPASAPSLLAGGRAAASEKELDESIARFHAAAENGADALFLMGVELRKMRDFLWQQRAAGGKPKYKSYNQFVVEELKISRSTADRARRIAESFSRDQFRKYGAGFLKALIAAPKEEHAQLLERIDAGEIQRPVDLENEVKQIREKGGIEVVETDDTKAAAAAGKNVPSAATTAAAAKARKKESAAITVGLKATSGTSKLFAKPFKKGDPDRRATSIDDVPYGKVEGINGVTLYVAVKKTPAGELEIRWTAKRASDEE